MSLDIMSSTGNMSNSPAPVKDKSFLESAYALYYLNQRKNLMIGMIIILILALITIAVIKVANDSKKKSKFYDDDSVMMQLPLSMPV